VVSSSIADIFRANAVKNGLLPVVVDAETHRLLLERPGEEITIDLETQEVRAGGRRAWFPIDPFARVCLLNGTDELGFLLAQEDAIAAFERRRAEEEAA
jgi:3-isopropylmalate/(R)-2-methylmalate dehydratase small subunit